MTKCSTDTAFIGIDASKQPETAKIIHLISAIYRTRLIIQSNQSSF